MSNFFNLPDNFTITAHTGCEDTPENSIESIIKSFECGADIFEVDVRFDENGIPILSHNTPTGGEPTLEEAFQTLARYKKMRCNIDIKQTNNLKIIPILAKKYDVLDRIFYTGIYADDTEAAKETPEISYYLNMDVAPIKDHTTEYLLSLVKKVKNCDAIGINCQHNNVTKELIDVFHNHGLLVSIWTCNTDDDIRKTLNISPDNITTKRPIIVKNIISVSNCS